MANPDISVVVCTYNPDWEELRRTLKSVLLQTGVHFEIVICDDGSADPLHDKIEAFFLNKGFGDYHHVINTENNGTVINIMSGIDAASGRFIKLISPGDYLYGSSALNRLLECAISNKSDLAFGDVIFFDPKPADFTPIEWEAWPQDAEIYNDHQAQETIKRNQLLLSDNIHGVSTIVSRDLFIKYLEMVKGKVKYCEDLVYRLMVNDGVCISYCNEAVVLYGFGDGISTSQDDKWNRLIKQDWDAVNQIIIESGQNSNSFIRKFKKVKDTKFYRSKMIKMASYMVASPHLLMIKTRRMLFKRLTCIDVDKSYISILYGGER